MFYLANSQYREEPETFHFLAARDNVPLKTEFKPALKVLSRKPAPTIAQRVDPVTGLAKLSIDDDDDEVEQKKPQPTPEELRLKAQREREEKQRKYDEAKARIYGTVSGTSTPGTVTPPREDGKPSRGKGRGRGQGQDMKRTGSNQLGTKELFDPNYTAKPGVSIQKRDGESTRLGRSTSKDEDQIIRPPKGPNGSGKGFGFANRGGKTS